MKNRIYLLLLLLLFSACSNKNREHLGLVKVAPDEYQVMTNQPLIIPPDVNVVPVEK